MEFLETMFQSPAAAAAASAAGAPVAVPAVKPIRRSKKSIHHLEFLISRFLVVKAAIETAV
jgi:hypothetical protein